MDDRGDSSHDCPAAGNADMRKFVVTNYGCALTQDQLLASNQCAMHRPKNRLVADI